jgi:5-oxoprolinase (ATP-hydrolysing) subunit A
MIRTIDLNADVGEYLQLIRNGQQEAIMMQMSSVNIACGGHSGDASTMSITIQQALRYGHAIGAHPSYPDPANFGRADMNLTGVALTGSIHQQILALDTVARSLGARLSHVKPHGALYNAASRQASVAQAIAQAMKFFHRGIPLMALANSVAFDTYLKEGIPVIAEGFADRAYAPDGTLIPRHVPGAVINDPERAATQALGMARMGVVRSICLHSDSPGALNMAIAVRRCLEDHGFTIRPAITFS